MKTEENRGKQMKTEKNRGKQMKTEENRGNNCNIFGLIFGILLP